MPKFSKFRVNYPNDTTPTHTFYFKAPAGSYAGIETEAGIQEVLPTAVDRKMPCCDVAELVAAKIVSRRYLRVNVTGARDKYAKIVVAVHKDEGFDAAVANSAFRGGVIEGTVVRQRASHS